MAQDRTEFERAYAFQNRRTDFSWQRGGGVDVAEGHQLEVLLA